MDIPEGKMSRRKQPIKEIIDESFPNVGKKLDIQVQGSKRILTYLNAKYLLQFTLY